MFFNLLLPVIIFSGGYNLKKKRFLQNFKYIVMFGFMSTLLNFLLTFSMTIAVNECGKFSLHFGRVKFSLLVGGG
jgi:sodium/hydrogen exchanger-like protein 6/7/sodium/hydrogen exchanger 8